MSCHVAYQPTPRHSQNSLWVNWSEIENRKYVLSFSGVIWWSALPRLHSPGWSSVHRLEPVLPARLRETCTRGMLLSIITTWGQIRGPHLTSLTVITTFLSPWASSNPRRKKNSPLLLKSQAIDILMFFSQDFQVECTSKDHSNPRCVHEALLLKYKLTLLWRLAINVWSLISA